MSNKQVITLQELRNAVIVDQDGNPAKVYSVAKIQFHQQADDAMDAAKAGDFSKISELITDVGDLIADFIGHGNYLAEEKAILQNPNGPEAQAREKLFEMFQSEKEKEGVK